MPPGSSIADPCIDICMKRKKKSQLNNWGTQKSPSLPVLPKHTLFKVLYFVLAEFKNYTLLIFFFNHIIQKYFL